VRLLERARDLAQAAGAACLEAEHVDAAAERSGIDAEGLRSEERRILELLLARGRPLGIETLAAALRLDARTIRRVHEPYLLERGYLERGLRGRRATREARRRFGSPLPASSPPRRSIPVFRWRDFAPLG
jgi:Holliday junction DNA helicase RuvB